MVLFLPLNASFPTEMQEEEEGEEGEGGQAGADLVRGSGQGKSPGGGEGPFRPGQTGSSRIPGLSVEPDPALCGAAGSWPLEVHNLSRR